MALTNTLSARGGKAASSPDILLVVDVLTDASYPNPAGYVFDPGGLLKTLLDYDKDPEVKAVDVLSKAGHTFEFDAGTKTLHIFTPAGVEIANGVDIAAALGGTTPALIHAG